MTNLKSLRKRINGIKSTQKITKAMQLVAANKLSKAQEVFAENALVLETINKVAQNVFATSVEKDDSSILKNDSKIEVLIGITSDKGLCGGYNSSIIKFFKKRLEEVVRLNVPKTLILIGKKGKGYFQDIKDIFCYDNIGGDYLLISEAIADQLLSIVKNNDATIKLCYNNFKNIMSYEQLAKTIWPIEIAQNQEYETEEIHSDTILKLYLQTNVLNALLVSNASELSARMVAMDNATRNSKQIIETLTLQLNRSRQAMITKELIEIISGAEAL